MPKKNYALTLDNGNARTHKVAAIAPTLIEEPMRNLYAGELVPTIPRCSSGYVGVYAMR